MGKFAEFVGPGLANLPLSDCATIGNMALEYGSPYLIKDTAAASA